MSFDNNDFELEDADFAAPSFEDIENEMFGGLGMDEPDIGEPSVDEPVTTEPAPAPPKAEDKPQKTKSVIVDNEKEPFSEKRPAQEKEEEKPVPKQPKPEDDNESQVEQEPPASNPLPSQPQAPTPDPANVDLSGIETEEKAPEIDYEGRDNGLTDKQKELFRGFQLPVNTPTPPVYDQKITDTIPANTKNTIIKAFIIVVLIGMMFCMIVIFSKNGGNTGGRQTTNNGISGITDMTSQQSEQAVVAEEKSNKWEPGIIGKQQVATTEATTALITTQQMTTSAPIVTETTTEAVATEAPAPAPSTDSQTQESSEKHKPSDSRFADVPDLTLYIQNSSSVVIRKEQELVQNYVDGRVDKTQFLDTMGTYSTAMDELSRLLILNKPCYEGDEETYNTLESSISVGMSYAERSLALANADTPLSDFINQLK